MAKSLTERLEIFGTDASGFEKAKFSDLHTSSPSESHMVQFFRACLDFSDQYPTIRSSRIACTGFHWERFALLHLRKSKPKRSTHMQFARKLSLIVPLDLFQRCPFLALPFSFRAFIHQSPIDHDIWTTIYSKPAIWSMESIRTIRPAAIGKDL